MRQELAGEIWDFFHKTSYKDITQIIMEPNLRELQIPDNDFSLTLADVY